MQLMSAPEHSHLGRTGERPVQRLCLRQLAPTCLLRDPRRALTLRGFVQLGTFLCVDPCAHALLCILLRFLRFRIFLQCVIARRPGYATSGKILDGARTSFAYNCSPDLRHLTVSSNYTSVAIPSLRAPPVRGTAASRSAALQLQQPPVIDGQARAVPSARANRTEPRVRKVLT